MKGLLFTAAVWEAKKRVLDDTGMAVTRRLDNLEEINREPDKWELELAGDSVWYICYNKSGDVLTVKPRYHVGETVYIKEAYSTYGYPEVPFYKGEPGIDDKGIAWRSPLFMPAHFARYFVQITYVRPERLQEITERDAIAEGIRSDPTIAIYEYSRLWDSINKKYTYASNPWCFRIAFKRVPQPSGETKPDHE